MKKALLVLLLSLTACGLAESERDEENRYIRLTFTDSAFEQFCLGKYDLNKDGHLSRYEAQRVLTMDCSNLNIASLTDLKEFTRLQKLVCAGNKLATLDLRSCSDLETVDCSANTLVSLQIEGLRSLTALDCHANPLPALNLTSAVSLRTLDCRSTALVTLDVTTCSRSMTRVDARLCSLLRTVYCLVAQQTAILTEGTTSVEVK